VVAELGAGYAKLAYFYLRDLSAYRWIDFDLPETICLAAYYLLKTFPAKRTVLYGETGTDEALASAELVLLPSFEIERLNNQSVDLFVNVNSLGEMGAPAAANFVKHITRSTRYFFHLNHDAYRAIPEGPERSLLASEYPVPADFVQLFRYPDVIHLLYKGFIDFESDTFLYLYARDRA
jgi:hypothetical protein